MRGALRCRQAPLLGATREVLLSRVALITLPAFRFPHGWSKSGVTVRFMEPNGSPTHLSRLFLDRCGSTPCIGHNATESRSQRESRDVTRSAAMVLLARQPETQSRQPGHVDGAYHRPFPEAVMTRLVFRRNQHKPRCRIEA
jgi:hypothetical protein